MLFLDELIQIQVIIELPHHQLCWVLLHLEELFFKMLTTSLWPLEIAKLYHGTMVSMSDP
jgi:hypothetical protein